MRFFITYFIVLSILFSVLGCKNHSIMPFPYAVGTNKYLQDVHDIQPEDYQQEEILFFLNVSSCDACVHNFMGMLTSIEAKNLNLFIIGENRTIDSVYRLPESITIYRDVSSEINRYRTGFSKPMLLRIQDGIYEAYEVYESYEDSRAKDDIQSVKF